MTTAGSKRAVRFVIPIRHPDGVHDRSAQLAYLRSTLASLAAQTCGDWTATLVVNEAQVLPDLPERVRVRTVELPPNTALAAATTRDAYFEALRADKGQRIAAGLADVGENDLIMPVDEDDLVHRDLVGFVLGQPPGPGWVIDRGYWWETGSRLLSLQDRFNSRCGTSLLVPPGHYAHFAGGLGPRDAIQELGSHKLIFKRRPKQLPDWRPVPFPAAIYRLHPGSATRSDQLAVAQGGSTRRRKSRWSVSELKKLRLLTPAIRREFFGGARG